MVEYTLGLDAVFASLADPTRRDIMERVARAELAVGEIARRYDMSLAAISKHLKILEAADLIRKRREGKKQMVQANIAALNEAREYLRQYEAYQKERYDALEQTINEEDSSWQK